MKVGPTWIYPFSKSMMRSLASLDRCTLCIKKYENFLRRAQYGKRFFFSGNEMRLIFKRKLSRSLDNKSAVITVPRAIAQSWEQYSTVALVFDGNCLVITPTETITHDVF
jgi:hypothetical protein